MLALLGAATVAVACAGGDGQRDDAVVVFAAASLAAVFDEIVTEFEAGTPGTEVVVNVAGSSTLVAQVLDGAPVDVIATADTATMQRLVDEDLLAGTPVRFARNRPAIVVASGNPLDIRTVSDLADPDLVVLTCAVEVPCGAYANEIFDAAGVVVVPDSLEANVGAVVTKIALGEADAGIAYVTDVAAADGRVDGVAIEGDVEADYPIAIVAGAAPGDESFVEFVLGPTGQTLLAAAGFEAP